MITEEKEKFCWRIIIKTIGVGGAGCKSVDYMINNNLVIKNDRVIVDFISADTDYENLSCSIAENSIPLGMKKSQQEIINILQDIDILFIVAGMGGKTGTKSSTEIAKIAYKMGIFTVAVVSMPLSQESKDIQKRALSAIVKLNNVVESCIVISSDSLISHTGKQTNKEIYQEAEKSIMCGVNPIIDLIIKGGSVCTDITDIIVALYKKKG